MPATNIPASSAPESYTTMDKDVEAIGSHCQFSYCNQLDFLPFRCESCRGIYCLDHRTEAGHQCSHAGTWAAARREKGGQSTSASQATSGKPTLLTATQCSHVQCKTLINTLTSTAVLCPTCNRQYCLKHRLREDHSCDKLAPIGARQSSGGISQAEKAKTALKRLQIWGQKKQAAVLPKPKPSTAASRSLAVNQLKKTAKGDDKVPVEKRLYLHVEAEANTTTSKLPKGEFWYNNAWSVGRMLDEAARNLQVQNVNNRGGGEDQKLRIFHVEGGRLLDFGETAGDVLASGNTIVLLRGVGPISQ
ncbi:MAG: hypothetical protein LQ342_005165 [Letrouitia transgressa]|nr:MAG: hypothetical protein LQ342_005165 [Letrouitia transgressa]